MSFQKPSKAQELADEMFQSDIRNKQRNSSSAEAYVILTRMRIKQEDGSIKIYEQFKKPTTRVNRKAYIIRLDGKLREIEKEKTEFTEAFISPHIVPKILITSIEIPIKVAKEFKKWLTQQIEDTHQRINGEFDTTKNSLTTLFLTHKQVENLATKKEKVTTNKRSTSLKSKPLVSNELLNKIKEDERLEGVRKRYYEKAVKITTRKITSLINNISYLENIPENQDFSELGKGIAGQIIFLGTLNKYYTSTDIQKGSKDYLVKEHPEKGGFVNNTQYLELIYQISGKKIGRWLEKSRNLRDRLSAIQKNSKKASQANLEQRLLKVICDRNDERGNINYPQDILRREKLEEARKIDMYNNRPSVKNKTKKSKTEQAAANEKNHLAKARILEIERIGAAVTMVTKIEELLSSNENTSKYLSSAQKNAEPIFYYCIFFSVLHKYFSSTENNKGEQDYLVHLPLSKPGVVNNKEYIELLTTHSDKNEKRWRNTSQRISNQLHQKRDTTRFEGTGERLTFEHKILSFLKVRNDKRDIKRSIEDQKRLGFLRQQEINRTEVNRRAREQELEEERLQKAAIPQFQRDKATKEKINATRHRKRLETTTKYISSLSSNMDEYIKRFGASIDFEKRKELGDSKDLVTIGLLWYLYKNDGFNGVEHKKLDYLVALPKLGGPGFINNEKFLNILYSQSGKDEEQRTKEVNSIISGIKKARDTTTLRSGYNFQDKLRSVLTDRRGNRTK